MPITATAVEVPHWVPNWNPNWNPDCDPNWNPNATAPKSEETTAQSMQNRGQTNPDTFFYNATHFLGGVG